MAARKTLTALAILTAGLIGCQTHGVRTAQVDPPVMESEQAAAEGGAFERWHLPAPLQLAGWFKSEEELARDQQAEEQPVPQGTTYLAAEEQSAAGEQGPYFLTPIEDPISTQPAESAEDSEPQESVLQRMRHGLRSMFTPHRPASGLRKAISRPFRALSQRAVELPPQDSKAIPLPIAAPKGVAAMGGKLIGWPAPRSWANPVLGDSPQVPEMVRSAGNDEAEVLLSNGRSSANGPVMSVPLWHGEDAEK